MSNSFENNPFFIIDVNRFGYNGALREWIVAAKNNGRQNMTNPIDVCEDCQGNVWRSATRPALCFDCYKAQMAVMA
jgi:hypothetical protein